MTIKPATIFDPNVGDRLLARAIADTPLSTVQIGSLTVTQMAPLSTLQVGALTVTQLVALATSQIGCLTTTQVGCLSASTLGNTATFTANGATLTTVQIGGLTAGSMVNFTMKTPGGTVGALPTIVDIQPTRGVLTCKATALDTSTYNVAALG